MSGRGLQYVSSRITRPDLLPESLFLTWYTQEHIPEVISKSGPRSAFRYVDVDETAERPYLVLYPADDIAYFQGPESKANRVRSDLLPGSGEVFDVADFDIRYYTHVQTYEPAGTKSGRGKCLISVGVEPGPNTTDEEFDSWYRKQHLDMISMCDHYLRTTRYKISSARQNKLPASDKTIPDPPKFLALHEFDRTELPATQLAKTAATEWSRQVLGDAKVVVSRVYVFVEGFGEGDAAL